MEFDHTLALALGGMTVEELRERMDYAEWVRWAAYFPRKAAAERRAIERARRRASPGAGAGRGR